MKTIGISPLMNRTLHAFHANDLFQYFLKISGNRSIIAGINPKIVQPRRKFNINNFGLKRSVISSRLTELKIFFCYALQTEIKSLKGDSILNTNQQNIKNAMQRGVGQLCKTNRYRVMEFFLEPALLFSVKNKYANIKSF